MKKMYWTNYNVHPYLMVSLAVISLLMLYVVESYVAFVPSKNYRVKLDATLKSKQAFAAIKKARKEKKIAIDKKADPAETGLIGVRNSIITSDKGVLKSKQISTNPNLAALMVEWLSDLKLKKGDVVAIGMTGSFPALDISTLSAIDAMQLKPLVIVSATASQYGANIPGFSLLDMLNTLNQDNILPYKPIAASIGAAKDLGKGLQPEGVKIITHTIKKYGIPLIKEPLVSKSINKRLELYQEAAGDKPIKAYINIGGGVASIGKHFIERKLTSEQKEELLKHSLKTGPNLNIPVALANTNSVAVRFLKLGVPVINVKNVNLIAAQYGLKPWRSGMKIGVGPLFYIKRYNIWLAIGSLFIILLVCWLQVNIQTIQKREQAGELSL